MATIITRVPAVWGTAEWIDARPGLTLHEHAVYHPGTTETPHRVVPASPDLMPVETAPDGLYILLDVMTEHYGHFIADVMARLWPLADRIAAPVRIVCEPRYGRTVWERHRFMSEILAGLDLDCSAVVSFEEATTLPRVLVPEPGFHNLRCIHAVFGDLCRLAGRRYWREAEVDTNARPAYLAKTRLKAGTQHFSNEAAVVAELDRRGVDIIFPEEMSFADQVRLFATRRVVLGPVGSAFHTAAFSAPGRRIVGLSGMIHLNSNYLMFDAINGARARYYFAPGTTYQDKAGFGLGFTIPAPREVAAELLRRAEDFDRIDRHDAQGSPQAMGSGLVGHAARLRRRLSAQWDRLRARPSRTP